MHFDFQQLILSQGVLLAVFLVGGVGGVFPLINVELFLVLTAGSVAKPALVWVALLTAMGQVVAVFTLFWLSSSEYSNTNPVLWNVSKV